MKARLRRSDSERIWQNSEATQLFGSNLMTGLHTVLQSLAIDMTAFLKAAGEDIYRINAEGKATFVNRAAQEMLGWNADDLIGRDLYQIIRHHHLNGDQFYAHGCPIYASFWRKDGKPILVEYVSTQI